MYEVLLVLMMTTGLAVVVARPTTSAPKLVAERAFWPAYQRLWTATRQLAVRRRARYVVHIDSDHHQVEVLTTTTPARQVSRLPIPRSLTLADERAPIWDLKIYESGWAQGTTVEWYSQANHRWWYQAFQLRGAMIHVTSETTRRPPKAKAA
ncbi:hypothetical protein [Levilactobacillus suantsaii]|uniref:Type II secretion system protein n=1 Tax=Levilactobacillus suantsaii TaxID=2292255 RepID=A0A4V1LFL3_9LACO|nr:hypothetical protein [Levilactobacillus suantsaii]QMU07873.1 hypothetical protein H3M12_10590 [Levilactobacillus suantsaii]RXI79754.1 hypothetical protein DXH47_01055 [Levilactobacillus suantsaii]